MADRVANAESSIPSRRRRWRYIVGLLCLIVLLVVAAYLYRVVSAAAALSGAIAETDRLDPHWRFEELEASRSVVPEGENSADTVTGGQAADAEGLALLGILVRSREGRKTRPMRQFASPFPTASRTWNPRRNSTANRFRRCERRWCGLHRRCTSSGNCAKP